MHALGPALERQKISMGGLGRVLQIDPAAAAIGVSAQRDLLPDHDLSGRERGAQERQRIGQLIDPKLFWVTRLFRFVGLLRLVVVERTLEVEPGREERAASPKRIEKIKGIGTA